jgi:hypothetical protein
MTSTRHSLTFIDGVWSVISVGNAPVTISENVFREVPIMSRVWVIAGMPQRLHLRYDIFRLPVFPTTQLVSIIIRQRRYMKLASRESR